MSKKPTAPQTPKRRALPRRDGLHAVLRVWLVWVIVVTGVMFALDRYMGPVQYFWPLIGIYAVISLASSLALHRRMNRPPAATAQDQSGQATEPADRR